MSSSTTASAAMLRFSPRLSTFSCVLALMLTTAGEGRREGRGEGGSAAWGRVTDACARGEAGRVTDACARGEAGPPGAQGGRAVRCPEMSLLRTLSMQPPPTRPHPPHPPTRGVRPQHLAQVGADDLLVRRQLGPLRDDGAINVAHRVAPLPHQPHLGGGAGGGARRVWRVQCGACVWGGAAAACLPVCPLVQPQPPLPSLTHAPSHRLLQEHVAAAPPPHPPSCSPPPSPTHAASHRLLQEHVAARALPPRIGVGEELANVGEGEGAQDGVHHLLGAPRGGGGGGRGL